MPVWPGTRPYQQLPFQLSLHVLTANGTLRHQALLDLSGNDPSRSCAESLIAHCGSAGPVFAYFSPFACRAMRDLAARCSDLAAGLEAIIDRVVDLLPIARNRYYHPSQHGSWSLKAVLPAAVPGLSYDALDGVANGGMAAWRSLPKKGADRAACTHSPGTVTRCTPAAWPGRWQCPGT